MNPDLEEVISFYARRGDLVIVKALRELQEDYERSMDADYNPESDSEYNSSSEEESSEDDAVPEEFDINPSMNGFCSIS